MSAHLQYYRSQEGLGGRVTGQQVVSWRPFVTYDDAECLRIDALDIGEYSIYSIHPVVSCSLAFNATAETATLTVSTNAADHTSGATAIAEDATVTITTTDRLYSVTVTRVASGATGTTTIRPMLVQNNDIGHSDEEDPSGVVTYRCVYLYNAHTEAITITAIDCDSGWEASLEAASAETTQAIADESTAPSGPAFSQNLTPAQSIAAGEFVPLWIERTASADAGEHTGQIKITYTTGGSTYYGYMAGVYVTTDTSLTDFIIYKGFDEAGNGITVDSCYTENIDETATLPYSVDAATVQDIIHDDLGIDTFTMRLGVRRRMTTGAESQNQLLDYAIRLDYTSGDITKPPTPTIDSVTFLDGGQPKAVVSFDQTDAVKRAVKAQATCGSETLTAYLPTDEDTGTVDFVFQTPVTWGASTTVTAKTVAVDGTESATDSDTSTAYFVYEGQNGNPFNAAVTGAETTHTDEYITESFGDVDIVASPGQTSIECDGTLVFDARSNPASRHRITTLQITGGTITGGTCTDPIDPADATEFYLCAGGSRVAHVDLDADTLTCPIFTIENAIDCPAEGPYYEFNGVVYWQYFDMTCNRWKTFMAVDEAATAIRFFLNVDCEGT